MEGDHDLHQYARLGRWWYHGAKRCGFLYRFSDVKFVVGHTSKIPDGTWQQQLVLDRARFCHYHYVVQGERHRESGGLRIQWTFIRIGSWLAAHVEQHLWRREYLRCTLQLEGHRRPRERPDHHPHLGLGPHARVWLLYLSRRLPLQHVARTYLC